EQHHRARARHGGLSQLTCPCCGASVDRSAAITGPDRLQGTPGEFPVAVCSGCGAGITLPQLSAAELAPFYPQTYGPYDALEHGIAARISRAIQLWEGTRALRSQPLLPL